MRGQVLVGFETILDQALALSDPVPESQLLSLVSKELLLDQVLALRRADGSPCRLRVFGDLVQ